MGTVTHPNKIKKIQGVGVNDADYPVFQRIDGRKVCCPFYASWTRMLARCYRKAFHISHASYINATVANEWLLFSVFRSWMIDQDWKGLELDKDILIPGNKTYSPETCCFVTRSVNSLLNDHAAARGECPMGVYWNKTSKKFLAQIKIDGKLKHLGLFSDPDHAEDAYRTAKSAHLVDIANGVDDDRVADGLRRHAALFASGDHPSMKMA